MHIITDVVNQQHATNVIKDTDVIWRRVVKYSPCISLNMYHT